VDDPSEDNTDNKKRSQAVATGHGDSAIFLSGGVSSASSAVLESFCSTLRLVPASLDSTDGESEGDLDNESLNFCGGGVERKCETDPADNWASGVPERLPIRLPEASSVRNRAARLLVDDIASA
jgi:hypothetical protein